MILVVEGVVMCFVLLIICVIGIANGPVGLVVFYEQEVKNRVIELGFTTRDRIRKTSIITMTALFLPMLVLVPFMVYGINGAAEFWEGFRQMLVILMISGLFDRIFIDWWWVGRTKAWIIPDPYTSWRHMFGWNVFGLLLMGPAVATHRFFDTLNKVEMKLNENALV